MWLLSVVLLFTGINAFALECDCEVVVYSPVTGSHKIEPLVLKRFELETYVRHTRKSHLACQTSCAEKYREEISTERMKGLLLSRSQQLIDTGALGYNCTGLTNLKYPVRVKAILGGLGLGNVHDEMHSINHEEVCF